MLLYFYLFVPLLSFLPGDASSIRGRNNKNELVPFGSSELDSPGRDNRLRIFAGEPLLVRFRQPTPSVATQTTEKDKKRRRPTKKRVTKIKKNLKRKRRARRDLFTSKSKPVREEKSNSPEDPQSDNGTDHLRKNFTKNTANRVEILKALSSFSKKRENGHFKDEHKDGTQRGKHVGGSNRNHLKHRHSLSDQPLDVKMTYPASPKPDRHPRKYTYKDLTADRKRLEQKINYIKNMLSVNDTTVDDPIRIRRRSESDRTANKIAKTFLALSAVNRLHDRRKSKCRYGEEEEEEGRVQDVWEEERRNSPTRKKSSSNEERYKVKKWIEFMKNKRSSGKTCPCMANARGDDSDFFPLEQKLPKDYFLMERTKSSEESSEIYRDPYYSRDKLIGQNKGRSKGQEDQDKSKGKNGKKKLDLPLNDLELYRSRAKQILQNAEEILDRIKDEEDRRMSAPNTLMNHLKELTSRIQSDPRNNENDLIRKIQKTLGWSPLSKSESPDRTGFVDNVKSYIVDPYEKAKALTDESAKMLSSYLLRNLGKMKDSSEEGEPDQEDRDNLQVYYGKVQPKEEEKPLAASLAKEADPLSKNKEELQNWEDTISKIMNGAEEAVEAEPDLASNREVFKNRMDEIIKEQVKKLTDYEKSHPNDGETEDRTAVQQQKEEAVSENAENPSEESEDDRDDQSAIQQQKEQVKSSKPENDSERSEKVKSANPENLREISEEEENDRTANQQPKEEIKSTNPESGSERSEKDEQTAENVKSANPENSDETSEEDKDERAATKQQEIKTENPKSKQLEQDDPETEKVESSLTANAQAEEERQAKQSVTPSKKESSQFEKEDQQNIEDEELGKGTLDEITKTLNEDDDSVGNEREIKNPQENQQTVGGEEENEERNPAGESARTADDYDLLEEAPETGGNQKESSSEAVEMREKSDSGNESPEDNPELLDRSQEDTEIVNLEKHQDGDSAHVGETQTDLEEITQESEKFLQNTKPNEDNMKVEQDDLKSQTDDEPETLNERDNSEIVETESETIPDNEEDEPVKSTLENEETRFRYLDEYSEEEFDGYTPWQATNVKNTENDSLDHFKDETPLSENQETVKDETQTAEKADDEPSGKNDETNLKMAKDETVVTEKMNDGDPENEETKEEAPQEENRKDQEFDEDETALQKSNPNQDENSDEAQNSYESVVTAGDEGNLDEDEKSLKSINPQTNHENQRADESDESSEEALNGKNSERSDETLLEAEPKENPEDQNGDEKTSEETPLRSALGDDTEGEVQETSLEGENEQSSESSDGDVLKAGPEYLNPGNQTEDEISLKSENPDEDRETLKQALGEENQESSDETRKREEKSEGDETAARATSEEENNQGEGEAYLKKANSVENLDKTDENSKEDVDLETVDPKESENDYESPQTGHSGETVSAFLDDPEEDKLEKAAKTEQTESTEEESENPLRSPNPESTEETSDQDSSKEETRTDITDDSPNQVHPENERETFLKSEKLGEPKDGQSAESSEGDGYERSREDNLGENLILEETDEAALRDADSEENLPAFPSLLREPHSKTVTLKVPKSIGQIMIDLDEKDDVTSVQNLNPDKIDHIIDKIDEAEHLMDPMVDCRKECACADEITTKSRNIGRYEIAKDFLHWMKDLKLNRVLSDD